MEYITAFNLLDEFIEKLKTAVEYNQYVTLDVESCKEILEALDSVDY